MNTAPRAAVNVDISVTKLIHMDKVPNSFTFIIILLVINRVINREAETENKDTLTKAWDCCISIGNPTQAVFLINTDPQRGTLRATQLHILAKIIVWHKKTMIYPLRYELDLQSMQLKAEIPEIDQSPCRYVKTNLHN